MNVLLIGPDSKFPNLALMKISAYHKSQGDVVGFNVSKPDRVYMSILFWKNRSMAYTLKWMYPAAGIVKGGPGYDPKIRLPSEIEEMAPDQSIYKSKYSIGRVTSGCPRKCHFCMVPQMEPHGIRYIQPPSKIWKGGKSILRLLDDNILSMPSAFWEVHDYCIANNTKVHFEYLDARLITEPIAKGLKEMHHDGGIIHFSYDITAIEPAVRKAVAIMKNAGFRANALEWLIYLHDEKSIPDAEYRWNVIRSLGCEPFLMVNNENRTKALRRIARRGCRPAIWRNLDSGEVFATTKPAKECIARVGWPDSLNDSMGNRKGGVSGPTNQSGELTKVTSTVRSPGVER